MFYHHVRSYEDSPVENEKREERQAEVDEMKRRTGKGSFNVCRFSLRISLLHWSGSFQKAGRMDGNMRPAAKRLFSAISELRLL
ncbi:hypothetical protein SDC9_102857 [bioreactor metagenome]|uniref:Uncharacterized protein n=1 Tax=bioreactor metagenome TaxID=1076179 RepID=A0A645ATG9_9ZZZZ